MAALGVGAISGMVTKYRIIIQLIGGIVLLAFGLRLWFDTTHLNGPPAQSDRRPTLTEIVWDIPKTFILTVTNPGAVLGLIAIFGAVSSFVEIDGPIEALMLVASIMAGSLAWWTFLSVAASRVRDRIDGRRLHQINRVAGLLLISFALLLLGELSAKMLRLM